MYYIYISEEVINFHNLNMQFDCRIVKKKKSKWQKLQPIFISFLFCYFAYRTTHSDSVGNENNYLSS
jgi:hypothetical protein